MNIDVIELYIHELGSCMNVERMYITRSNHKRKPHELLLKYNSLPYECYEEKYTILEEMFESIGEKVSIGHSFICDYGCNISIGNNVLIAPNVQIYTAPHPIELDERLTLVETEKGTEYIRHTYALPVTIEDGCWIGGDAIILPGVTIEQGSVIGAGSVVSKSIPANSLAVGNPCKVIRKINIPCNHD